MTCQNCVHFMEDTSPIETGDSWGRCRLIMPPWISRSLNKAGEREFLPFVRKAERCSFFNGDKLEFKDFAS